MHVEFFRQLRQRHVILERRQRDLRFERRHMVPSGSFHPCSLVGRYLRLSGRERRSNGCRGGGDALYADKIQRLEPAPGIKTRA